MYLLENHVKLLLHELSFFSLLVDLFSLLNDLLLHLQVLLSHELGVNTRLNDVRTKLIDLLRNVLDSTLQLLVILLVIVELCLIHESVYEHILSLSVLAFVAEVFQGPLIEANILCHISFQK